MLDHTIGYVSPPEPPRYTVPECPCCGNECYYYFLDINRSIIACEECRRPGGEFDSVADAYEYREAMVW